MIRAALPVHLLLAASSLLAAGALLASCVSPPLYAGPPRSAASHDANAAGPGYTGLIHDGVVRRSPGRRLTTASEVPRDALGNPVLPEANPAAAQKPRHRRKHWFGL